MLCSSRKLANRHRAVLSNPSVFFNGSVQRRTLMFSTAHKWMEACLRFHPIDLFWKLYNNGDVKFGKHVGTDRFGTKYYEDPLEVHGQQRYVEFKQEFYVTDASQIPPEWHAWLVQNTDSKPGDPGSNPANWVYCPTAKVSHAPFKTHLGPVGEYKQNLTGARQRGYMIGSHITKPGEPDLYYMQPNHPRRNPKRPQPIRDTYANVEEIQGKLEAREKKRLTAN